MKNEYALLPDRVKAAFIDSLIMVAAMYATTEIFALFEEVHVIFKIISVAFIFALYEPLFISFYGGTIGHSYMGVTVKRDSDSGKNVIFPLALLRFILKYTLGWLSFLTVTGHERKKAIHDLAANSVVLKTNEK
ncbi:RDD family protein [Maribacter sp. 2304DJ31-5]|uniref:RDD family protein n=1 Tax=Maribacter sp. 2304DJ31-5 TaxID=3386273 RepID=UPI0039BC6703